MHFYVKILLKMLFHRRGILEKHFRKAFPYEEMPMKKLSLAGEAFLKSIFGIDSPYQCAGARVFQALDSKLQPAWAPSEHLAETQ